MKCKNCGNDKYFSIFRRIAYWDWEYNLWRDDSEGDRILVCDDCGDDSIEDAEFWDV